MSFYYPVSFLVVSPLIVSGLERVDLQHCRGTRWDVFGLNGYTPRWASYRDADCAVAGCAPCAFFPISAYFDPLFYCRLRNLTDVGPFEKFGTFRIAELLSLFKRMSPDDTECGITWRVLCKANEALD